MLLACFAENMGWPELVLIVVTCFLAGVGWSRGRRW